MKYMFINDKELEEIIKGCIESCYDDVNNKNLFITEVTNCILRNLSKKR